MNTSCILLSQNLFYKSAIYRTASVNSHYIVVFKSPRDISQLAILARQMFPQNPKYLLSAYLEATKKGYGYLLLDFRQETPDTLRVRSNLLPSERPMCVYLQK